MSIGIFDYGIGGVSLYKRLREFTTADVIYLSDTGYVPYGKVPEEELRLRVQTVTDYLFEQGVELVIIACNAASTVAPEHNSVISMLPFGVAAVRETGITKLGIVGGYRTVESEMYKKPLEHEMHSILQEVGQALSIRMEAGDLDSPELDADIEQIFHPLEQCEGILLACTHYPALKQRIQPVVPNVQLIDPMDLMVGEVGNRIKNLSGNSKTIWQTTGSAEKMQTAAQKAFHVTLNDIQIITL